LAETVKELAFELALILGKSSLGLNLGRTGCAPSAADIKERGGLNLIGELRLDHLQATVVLGISDLRAHRWRSRFRNVGFVVDRAPGGKPVHRILPWEEKAALDLVPANTTAVLGRRSR
jgi:hypothetical protein